MMLKRVSRLTLLCWLLLQGLPAAAQIPTIPTDSAGRAAAPCQFLNTTTNRWQSCDDVTGLPTKVTNQPVVTPATGAATPPTGIGVAFTAASTPASTGAGSTGWLEFLTDYSLVFVRDIAGATPWEAWYSYDRGRTWTSRYAVARPGGLTGAYDSQLLVRSGTTWLRGAKNGGGADLGKVFATSADGGRTWSLGASVGALATEVHVLGYSGSRVVAGTCNDWKLWTSDNFGGSWTERQTPGATTCIANEAKFLGSNTWLVGWGDQLIYRSTNNGVTWTQVYNHGSGAGVSFAVVNSTTILAVFGTASVVKSTDSGATWSVVATLPGGSVRAQGILYSQGIGLVVGQDQTSSTGHYWRSTDTGTTWSDGGALPVYPGCGSGHCPSFPRVNSLGDVVVTHTANDSVSATIQYSPVKLQGEMTLFSASGTELGSASNPLRVNPTGTTTQPVSGTTTANQGTAAAGTSAWPVAPVQGATLFNSQTTGAADTAVAVTIAAAASTRAHVYNTHVFCSTGTSTLTITDGGTTIWSTTAGEIGTARFEKRWEPGLTGATNSQVVITLGTCGAANTGTLHVQADRF